MSGIKYYTLKPGEEPPDEFCAVSNVNGEPRRYTFYGITCNMPSTVSDRNDEIRALKTENAKLRELVRDYHTFLALAELAQPIGHIIAAHGKPTLSVETLDERYRELGIEVDG